MKALVSLLVAALVLLSAGCVQTVNVDQEKAKLLDTDRAFAKTSLDKGAAEAFNMFLAEYAMQMPSRGEPVVGRAKIYEEMKAGGNIEVLEWAPQDGEVASSGDMGWTWGKSTYYFFDEAGEMQMRYGKYLNVWKKQSDGSWKVVVDIGNSSPAPEAE